MGVLLDCGSRDPKCLFNQLNQHTEFPPIHVSDILLTGFLEAWIPFATEAIVFHKQILARIC